MRQQLIKIDVTKCLHCGGTAGLRLTIDPIGLTKDRGVKEFKRKFEQFDEENPPEARSPAGRLHRAIRIYRDIRHSHSTPAKRVP